ncbi:beta-lactamase domain protein [Natrialba magadii ATCC 43099]|uniref:Beta-lactamase n=1 Tax=Natrialba magadii (strain ATCC 43099 / DSM 3394 / CCM 3739 / CIP 104546 / IAM 13178 / JCM 8861 / NBRC 102185 / NCIMB 2190 / MS3) TaxID=547559 RepID=D3SZX7_NATMM|nr:MBL fold metallo-hydrolase [Natrialba magadii]ADD06387.1 beta-lactamase domain protein [Natrialba magadii ATCC 43099]ELY31470.1 beta-lactamase [Natrialba magadii ATCC 43099]
MVASPSDTAAVTESITVTRCAVPVETRAPSGETNAYVLGEAPAVLVDPAARTDALDELVANRTIEHIVVTHTHPDHVGAVTAYADETDATVWARRSHLDRFEAVTGFTPHREFGPDTTIRLDDTVLRILDAPGHAPDHVALECGRNGPILCGDCAISEGSVVVGAPEGDMRAYVTTLRRLWAQNPPALYPGHGPTIDAPRETLERLLEHRAQRERRVLAAVEDGATTLAAILDSAYEKNLTGVRDLARATVRAHLQKLDAEGALEWDADRGDTRVGW